MLGRLCNSLGVSGYEKNTTNIILQALDEVSNNTSYVDKVGNVVYKKRYCWKSAYYDLRSY